MYKPDFQDPQFKDVTGVGEAPPPGKAFRRSFKSSAVNKLWIFMEDVSFPIIFLLNSCIFSGKRIDLYNFYYFIFCQIQNREIFWQLWWLTDRKCSNAQVRWPWKFEITYLFLVNLPLFYAADLSGNIHGHNVNIFCSYFVKPNSESYTSVLPLFCSTFEERIKRGKGKKR